MLLPEFKLLAPYENKNLSIAVMRQFSSSILLLTLWRKESVSGEWDSSHIDTTFTHDRRAEITVIKRTNRRMVDEVNNLLYFILTSLEYIFSLGFFFLTGFTLRLNEPMEARHWLKCTPIISL